jgi:hypothetical protein
MDPTANQHVLCGHIIASTPLRAMSNVEHGLFRCRHECAPDAELFEPRIEERGISSGEDNSAQFVIEINPVRLFWHGHHSTVERARHSSMKSRGAHPHEDWNPVAIACRGQRHRRGFEIRTPVARDGTVRRRNVMAMREPSDHSVVSKTLEFFRRLRPTLRQSAWSHSAHRSACNHDGHRHFSHGRPPIRLTLPQE